MRFPFLLIHIHARGQCIVPFAEPPTGSLRFQPPRPKAPFRGTHSALNFSAECLQSTLHSAEDEEPRSEDCLYLNIWAPAASTSPLPVLVWVYGGAFMHGAASKPTYRGEQLAKRGVVVVSLNYRVGALGFLVSTADGLFGNYGLADQKLALLWVQSHIRSFGGDPSRVTLFGESAGAMSIGLHYLDQHSERELAYARTSPLFHAVVLQSNPLGYKYRSVDVANFIGESYKQLLDCEDLACLLSESADELLHVQDSLMASPRSIGDFFTWGPVVTDESWRREHRLRPDAPVCNVTVAQPMRAIRSVVRANVPVLIGTNTDEGVVFVYSAFGFRMNRLTYLLLVVLFFRASAPAVLKTYAQLAHGSRDDYRQVLSTIINDYLFRCPNLLYAQLLAATGSTVFLYSFGLETRTPGFPHCDGKACHTAELPYVFAQMEIIARDYAWMNASNVDDAAVLAAVRDRRAADERVARLMADYWTTFARHGDPNGQPLGSGYASNTRPANAPLWSRLLGEQDRSESRPVGGREGRVATFGGRRGSASGRGVVLLLQFAETVRVRVGEGDCVCDLWDRLQYRF